jgi:hypothetical protein
MAIWGQQSGAVAQLGERLLCKQDVVGSIPSGSTTCAIREDCRFQPPRCGLASAQSVRIVALVLRRDEVPEKVIRIKVCGELLGSPLVLSDIVKRRFVRTS